MPRICFILIAGLDQALLAKAGSLRMLTTLPHRTTYAPPFPAVTSTVQATLTTGSDPCDHGIICNGLYTHNQPDLHSHLDLTNHADARIHVSFWEQSNSLLQRPRFWRNTPKKVAMLFWQNSIGAADIVLTPKPTHTTDGKTLSACFSNPPDLYPTLVSTFGPFPLHNYWSPMAGVSSSQWITQSALHVWQQHAPDLQLVYIPHLDYNLQRLGPAHPAIPSDLQTVDSLLGPLALQIRADGGILIFAGDYGMTEVHSTILPNLALRNAGLLATKPDANGKIIIDYDQSKAFTLCDHQFAVVYVKPGYKQSAADALLPLSGIDLITEKTKSNGFTYAHLRNDRYGDLILHANPHAWFAHDWWLSDDEKPAWQFSVDIHNKPGYDPRELFFDPIRKCIAQNPALVKGSHGLTDDPIHHPVLLSDSPLPSPLNATRIAPWLERLLA